MGWYYNQNSICCSRKITCICEENALLVLYVCARLIFHSMNNQLIFSLVYCQVWFLEYELLSVLLKYGLHPQIVNNWTIHHEIIWHNDMFIIQCYGNVMNSLYLICQIMKCAGNCTFDWCIIRQASIGWKTNFLECMTKSSVLNTRKKDLSNIHKIAEVRWTLLISTLLSLCSYLLYVYKIKYGLFFLFQKQFDRLTSMECQLSSAEYCQAQHILNVA